MALTDLVHNTNSREEDLEILLKGKVKLVKLGESATVHIEKGLNQVLDVRGRMLLFLAGKLAWQFIEARDLWVKPSEFEIDLGLKGGTIRPSLMKFRMDKLVEYDKKTGSYRLNTLGLSELERILAELKK